MIRTDDRETHIRADGSVSETRAESLSSDLN